MRPFVKERATMVEARREEREHLEDKQKERWIEETKERQSRLNAGLRGFFDRITGKHRKTQKANERESLACHHRDHDERDTLIYAQMTERQALLERALRVQKRHQQERSQLAKNGEDLSAQTSAGTVAE